MHKMIKIKLRHSCHDINDKRRLKQSKVYTVFRNVQHTEHHLYCDCMSSLRITDNSTHMRNKISQILNENIKIQIICNNS